MKSSISTTSQTTVLEINLSTGEFQIGRPVIFSNNSESRGSRLPLGFVARHMLDMTKANLCSYPKLQVSQQNWIAVL